MWVSHRPMWVSHRHMLWAFQSEMTSYGHFSLKWHLLGISVWNDIFWAFQSEMTCPYDSLQHYTATPNLQLSAALQHHRCSMGARRPVEPEQGTFGDLLLICTAHLLTLWPSFLLPFFPRSVSFFPSTLLSVFFFLLSFFAVIDDAYLKKHVNHTGNTTANRLYVSFAEYRLFYRALLQKRLYIFNLKHVNHTGNTTANRFEESVGAANAPI